MASETIEMPEGSRKGPKHAAFAGSNFDRATLSKFIEIHPNSREQGLGSNAGFRLARQCEQAITIDVLFEVIGKQVERGIDIGFIVEAGGLSADEF
jgi:hypothetical protein